MMRRVSSRVPLAAIALCLLPIAVSAQQPLFTSRIDLVHVGVTVLDRDGNLVTDLEAEDFELLEDGRPQVIRYFSRSLAGEPRPCPCTSVSFSMPAAAWSATAGS